MLKHMLDRIDTHAEWFGIRHIKQTFTTLQSRCGTLQPARYTINNGFRLELMQEGQLVYVGFQEISDLQNAIDRAHILVKQSLRNPLCHFSTQARPKATGTYNQQKKMNSSDLGDLALLLHNADLMVKNAQNGSSSASTMRSGIDILDSLANLEIQDIEEEFIAHNGTDIKQSYTLFSHTLSVTASKNGIIQSRSNGTPCHQNLNLDLSKEKLAQTADRILSDVCDLVEAENCPETTMDVLLHPDQLYLQIHESIGHPLELDRILGDERNYAGWSFIKESDFGTLQYGSPLMNVTFDPTVHNETASYAFDDACNPAQREYLIRGGKLERALGSLESQERSHVKGVANSRSTSWNRPPLDRMANINLEPGTSTLKDMISSTEKGIYMQTNNSWSIDDYRRKFQFGCEYGQLIEDGRLTKVVRNPNYRGETLGFWNNLKAVGNDPHILGSFYCGKGEPNQVIQVGHSTPHALFSHIAVFGGQS